MDGPIYRGPYTCPTCGRQNDCSAPNNPAEVGRPVAGDVSVCIGCGSIGLYTDDGRLRSPNMAEVAEVMRMPDVVRAVRAWQQEFGGEAH